MPKSNNLDKYKEALRKLADTPSIMLEVDPITLFSAVGYLQLGLRHPVANDEMADNVRDFLKAIQKALAEISPCTKFWMDRWMRICWKQWVLRFWRIYGNGWKVFTSF